jgi:hypothetical protein
MLCTRRVEHSEKNGTAYLSLGEIDMMLAVIMADGRYTDEVNIIPCTYTKNVSLASEAYSVQLQTLDRQRDNLCQTKGNLNDYIGSINEDHPKWQEYFKVKESLNEHDALTRKLRSELEGSRQ